MRTAVYVRMPRGPAPMSFDTDSFTLTVDNCASASITNNIKDFIEPPKASRTKILGISGVSAATLVGTVRWKIEDDAGQSHDIYLPNTYYAKTAPCKLLSPQHWSQVADDNSPEPNGTWCATYSDSVVLEWDQRKYRRTIPLSAKTNVGMLQTAPGFSQYCALTSTFEPLEPELSSPYSSAWGDGPQPPPTVTPEKSPHQPPSTPPPPLQLLRTASEGASHRVSSPGNLSARNSPRATPPVSPAFSATTTRVLPLTEQYTRQRAERKLREAGVMGKFNLNGPITTTTDIDDIPSFSKLAQEWKYWHLRLDHAPKGRLLWLIEIGWLPSRLKKLLKPPPCAGCLIFKAIRKPWRYKGEQRSIRKTTYAGECISVDQLDATTQGFIAQLKGWLTRKRYRYATIFVDHFSGANYLVPQVSLTSEETVRAKHTFETWAKSNNVQIRNYHAENGRFQDNLWRQDCEKQGQGLTFCGVNAHWQNGLAEKRIRDLVDMASVMLNYAQRKWPAAISTHLWPYALRAASDTNNSIPKIGEAKSPLEVFSSSNVRPNYRNHHHFGCPVYVLDGNLQAGKRAGKKWTDRARVGVNLGFSPQHAKSVALVLSLKTGLVSPQFHCQFDDTFETVKGLDASLLPVSQWQEKAYFVEAEEATQQMMNEEPTIPTLLQAADINLPSVPTSAPVPENPELTREQPQSPREHIIEETATAAPLPLPPVAEARTSRTGRTIRPPKHFADFVAHEALAIEHERSEANPLVAFKANSDPDTLYYHEAMKVPDAEQFRIAMQKEINDHDERGHWKMMRRDQLATGTRVLPAVWSMKRKRRIATGEIYRWKSRLTVDGSKQRYGVDYDETYSPVISWPAARFFLIVSLMQGWHARQLDFLLAYPQADVDRDMYIEIPRGIEVPGADRKDYCLKLIKNLYGQRQAGRVWYEYLKGHLLSLGFTQSSVDECVFYYKRTIFIVYVDDTILLGPDVKELDSVVKLLKTKFNVDSEGDGNLGDYLGIQLKKTGTGKTQTLELTQPQLIQSILEELGLTKKGATSRTTPALCSKTLGSDLHEPKFDNSFNYRRVIGKLLYLEKSTRPELAYAVHQCARFSLNPRRSHGEALKRIGRYLLGTADKGMLLQPFGASFDCYVEAWPAKASTIDCHVDASHAADWDKETAASDPSTAKSRMGWVISYGGCPLLWASKMQTEIALSTTEAEYIALSQSMREVLPLMELMKEAQLMKVPVKLVTPKVHCRVFEDNSGAIEIAKVPKMRPRTKHLNIKYHHFRSFVQDGSISVHHVGTEEQTADIFTKPLNQDLFQKHRKSLLGW